MYNNNLFRNAIKEEELSDILEQVIIKRILLNQAETIAQYLTEFIEISEGGSEALDPEQNNKNFLIGLLSDVNPTIVHSITSKEANKNTIHSFDQLYGKFRDDSLKSSSLYTNTPYTALISSLMGNTYSQPIIEKYSFHKDTLTIAQLLSKVYDMMKPSCTNKEVTDIIKDISLLENKTYEHLVNKVYHSVGYTQVILANGGYFAYKDPDLGLLKSETLKLENDLLFKLIRIVHLILLDQNEYYISEPISKNLTYKNYLKDLELVSDPIASLDIMDEIDLVLTPRERYDVQTRLSKFNGYDDPIVDIRIKPKSDGYKEYIIEDLFIGLPIVATLDPSYRFELIENFRPIIFNDKSKLSEMYPFAREEVVYMVKCKLINQGVNLNYVLNQLDK